VGIYPAAVSVLAQSPPSRRATPRSLSSPTPLRTAV